MWPVLPMSIIEALSSARLPVGAEADKEPLPADPPPALPALAYQRTGCSGDR